MLLLNELFKNCSYEYLHSNDYVKDKTLIVNNVITMAVSMQDFARHSERIFKDRSRRKDLDVSYSKLMDSLFDEIARVAGDSQKTPIEVVHFGGFS